MSVCEGYEIVGQLGEGAFGKVYKVKDKNTGELYAYKEYKNIYRTNIDGIKIDIPDAVLRETNILSRIHHPNVIEAKKIIVTDEPDLKLCVILELADTDLQKTIDFDDYDPLKLFFEIACGLKNYTLTISFIQI